MKIVDIHQQANLLNQINQAGGSKQTDKSSSSREAGRDSSSSDKVEISARSKEIKKVYEALEKAPDVRTDRVNALKEQIDKGRYEVKSDEVAGKMVDEFLFELNR